MNGIDVSGVDETTQRLRDFTDAAGKQEPTFLKIGNILVSEAKRVVPVRSHKLQASIVAKPTDKAVTITAGNASVEYAGVIHRRKAYLTIAQYNKEDEVTRVMNESLDDLVSEYFK